MRMPVTIPNLPQTVAELWFSQSRTWSTDLISMIFYRQATSAIVHIPTVPSDGNDTVRWKPAKKGTCTTKEAYKFLSSEVQVHIPDQGARSITQQALTILRRVCTHKQQIPPCIKTFCWRLITRALATGERAGNLSTKISKFCSIYNMQENDAHLFFHCTFARAAWFSAKPSLCTSMLPLEQDGVQEILSRIIDHNTSDEHMLKILTTLWYIWKARNDHRFNRKAWTVWQVHNAVAAGTSISTLAKLENEQMQIDEQQSNAQEQDQEGGEQDQEGGEQVEQH